MNNYSSEDWRVLLNAFPSNWKELAKTTQALTRKLRSFENEEAVIRALLLHVGAGYSLRETAARLKMSKIADVSDVALLKRLRCSENWLRELCVSLLKERGVSTDIKEKIRIRLVDGT